MNETQAVPGKSVRRFLVTAVVLESTAAALGFAGMAFGTVAVMSVARRRVARMETPPSEIARRSWAKARAATSAGMGAWRGMPAGASSNGLRRDRQPAPL
jgi:hypothetical protein